MLSALMTLLVLVAAGFATRGFVLRWFGVCCMIVGTCFFLVLAATGSEDVAGYITHVGVAVFGVSCWMVGHVIFATQAGIWRSRRARALFVGAGDFRAAYRSTRSRARAQQDNPQWNRRS